MSSEILRKNFRISGVDCRCRVLYNWGMPRYNGVMENTKRGKGTPKPTRYGKMISVRLTPLQERLIERLSARLQVAPVEVLRRGLMELGERQGINLEELGRGAEE